MKTMTKERPILFSGPMVRAILAGKKTQTRRVCKWPKEFTECCNNPKRDYVPHGPTGEHPDWSTYMRISYCESCDALGARVGPPWEPGDVLWVKETWTQDERGGTEPNGEAAVYYRADMPDTSVWRGYWKPSIHMPRWASRLSLEIKSVRVERVQDISEEDARAEGVDGEAELVCSEHCLHRDVEGDHLRRWREDGDDGYLCPTCGEKLWHHPIDECHSQGFRRLWDSINGKTYPFSSNPWVWVLEFEKVAQCVKPAPRVREFPEVHS